MSARWRALGMKTALNPGLPSAGSGRALPSGDSRQSLTSRRSRSSILWGQIARSFGRSTSSWTTRPANGSAPFSGRGRTHFPYDPPLATERAPRAPRDAYQSAVGHLDDVIADLTELLERRHLADNTVLVLVGDHGEAFSEHPESGSAHGAWLFEESTHIPMMLINPRLFHGERDGRLVQQKDLAATLTWLAGRRARANLNQGACLFYARDSETAYLTNPWDVASLRGAVVRGNLKYMFAQNASDSVADERLYDLTADPGERKRSVAGSAPRTAWPCAPASSGGWRRGGRTLTWQRRTALGWWRWNPRASPAVRNE